MTTPDEREQWNALSSSPEAGHRHQCLWWMEPLQRYGFRIHVLGCWRGPRLVGGALFRSYTLPLTPIIVTECLDGPIFREWETGWADELGQGIEALADRLDSTAVRIQDCSHPEVHRDVVAVLSRGGRKTTLSRGRADAVLPLGGRTMDDIWKGLNHGTRQRIKKGQRQLTVRNLSSSQELAEAYQAWMATASRKAFSEVRPWGTLEPVVRHCLDRRLGSVLGSFHGGRLQAAILVTHLGGTATYVYGGYRDEAERLSPGHLLQYAAIRESMDLGLGSYNFGYLLAEEQPDTAGVDQFKLGFGAVPKRHLETIIWERHPLLYASVERLRRGWLGRNLEAGWRRILVRRGDRLLNLR